MMNGTKLNVYLIRFLVAFGCALVLLDYALMGATQDDLKTVFENHYQSWKAHCKKVETSSLIEDRFDSPDYRAIVSLGPAVVPYIIEKMHEDKEFIWSAWTWSAITGVITNPNINPWAKESILSWWKGGRKQTKERFESLYTKWKSYKSRGMSVEANKILKSIRAALGIAALPLIVEKARQGDKELVSVMSELTGGKVRDKATVTECLAWWQANKQNWLIPFPNKKPVANAGQDRKVASGDIVQLDGTSSRDADKDKLAYKWTQITGPVVTLSDATAIKPTFVAPEVQELTLLTFQLTVSDGSPRKSVHPSCKSGQSDPDTVNITIKPKD